MSFQKALTEDLLNHIFGKVTYTPIPLFIGLSQSTGTASVAEISTSGTAYARVAVPTAEWDVADTVASVFTANSNTITFATATATWGTVKEAILCDAISGGNVLGRADAAIDKTISSGDVVVILPGKLKFTLL